MDTLGAPAPRLHARIARLAVYVAIVVAGLGTVQVRATRGRVDAALLALGEPLARSPRGGPGRRGPRGFTVGGERVVVATGLAHGARDAVLDAFARRCPTAAAPRDALPSAPSSTPPPAATSAPPAGELPADAAVLGARDAQHGYVACVAGLAGRSASELAMRVERAAQTGDLAALGGFRYLYARAEGTRTAWAAVWTEGAFRPARLASPRDEGGRDLPGVPAPTGARRTLSVESDDGFDRYASYVVAGRPRAEVLRAHRAALARAGYGELTALRTRDGADVVTARRGPRTLSAVYRGDAATTDVVLFDALP